MILELPGKEHKEEVVTSKDEGGDEDLQPRQSESESESYSDNPVDRNKAAKSSTPGVQTRTEVGHQRNGK